MSACNVDAVELKSKASLLQNELAVLRAELAEVQRKHKSQVDSLEGKVVELTKQRRILLENECELKAELEGKRDRGKQESKLAAMLASKTSELCKLEKLYQQSTNTIADLQKKLHGFQNATRQHASTPTVLIDSATEGSESDLREQLQLLQAQLDRLASESRSAEFRETAGRLVELNSENARLKCDNEYLGKINKNRLLMEERMHTFDQRMEELEDLRRRHAELSLRLATPATEDARDVGRLDELEATVKELQTCTEAQSSELSRTRVNADSLAAENARLKEACSALEVTVEELKDRLSLLQREHQMLVKERDNMREQLKFN